MENEMKLVKLSMKNSWHYKLVKWFLGNKSPKPSNTFNFCRYFWILMFCILLVPIFGPFKLIYNVFVSIFKFIDKYMVDKLDAKFNKWVESLDKLSFLEFCDGYLSEPNKFSGKYSKYSIEELWFMKNYNLDIKYNYDKSEKIISNLRRELAKDIKKESKEREELRKRLAKEKREQELRRKKLIDNINKKLSFINTFVDFIIDTVGSFFQLDFSKMIKIAKRIIGIIITFVFLVLTFFIANFMVLGMVKLYPLLTNTIVQSYDMLLLMGKIFLYGVILVIILYFTWTNIISFFIDSVKKYNDGKSILWIKWLDIIIVTPIYYILYVPLYWVVMIPLNFIFNHLLWKFICVKLIYGLLRWFGRGILGFTGIFGEYFAASKGDYCPGIEWVD